MIDWSAAEIARRIAAKSISAQDVCQAFVTRCQAVNPQLNAFTWQRFEQALSEATSIDERLARGETLGPLAGVPITVKDCFYFAGSTASIGLSTLQHEVSTETGPLVQRLQRAGAIVLGKTNVPQLMAMHECDNPVYGRTNNPWNLARTCGGSSGGEAAIIAARGSALGLANDLGGSIRLPAHFCGIAGLMPTARRLPNAGTQSNFRGFEGMRSSVGPLGRQVADLDLAMRVLADYSDDQALPEIVPWPWRDYRAVDIGKLRIGLWLDDGYLSPSPALQRATRAAADSLANAGATIEELHFPRGEEILDLYIGLIEADGCADLRRIAASSQLDWRISRMLTVGGLSRVSRAAVVGTLKMLGQGYLSRLIQAARPRSADEYWQLVRQRDALRQEFRSLLENKQLDTVISPPHALPAPQHTKAIDLMSAASYAFLPNLLGWPAGVTPVTSVAATEQNARKLSRDRVLQQAMAVDAESAGLPVGVQVIAPAWREDVVLAVMNALEQVSPKLRAVI
ncbi:Glutamyl-tRNA(Gln) amidotransferase subunit A [Anatilimnocola aggregata]|uniref:Glutamyl-tRNA(Gln) amidotransferase subunit A n=2 Tax=Anatilimnocola aggregata TaxID=2528021 RepID=A0A517YES3_9BACT|nr:Glutamyl-tRNA(Gln) amidotransferase subunit A [Anatilimnocola aggregata]